MKHLLIIFTLFINIIYGSEYHLFDKFYNRHDYKINNNHKLVIFYQKINKYIDETSNFKDYIFSYICEDPYLKDSLEENRSEVIFILTDESKLVYYIAYIKSCNEYKYIIDYINDDNYMLIQIDKYNIYINIDNSDTIDLDMDNLIRVYSSETFDIADIYLN